jgi:hypothetical protein
MSMEVVERSSAQPFAVDCHFQTTWAFTYGQSRIGFEMQGMYSQSSRKSRLDHWVKAIGFEGNSKIFSIFAYSKVCISRTDKQFDSCTVYYILLFPCFLYCIRYQVLPGKTFSRHAVPS